MERVLSPEISLDTTARGLTLRLQGVVGVMCAGELHSAALALVDEPGPVAIDGAQVEHLDCAAVQVLLSLHDALALTGRAAPLTTLSVSARRYLSVCGLAEPLGVADAHLQSAGVEGA